MVRFLAGLGLTVVCAGLLIRLIDWHTTFVALHDANMTFVAGAVTCLVISLIAKTERWKLMLPAGAPVTTGRLYRILHISFLLNNVLPARLGDVARVTMTSRQPGMRIGAVLSSLLSERVTDTLTLVTCFVIVSPFLPVPDEYLVWLHTAWYVVAGLIVSGVLIALLRRRLASLRLPESIRARVPEDSRLRAEASNFSEGVRQLFSRRRMIRIWGWSWAAWLGAFAINYMLMQALKIDAPFTVAVLLTCTTNLAMLLPSSPGYIGVFHAAATLSLLPFGVEQSTAFSFAILAHLVNVLPVSLMGAAFLLWGREGLPAIVRSASATADSASPIETTSAH